MKPRIWKENGVWYCGFSRDYFIRGWGNTPIEAYRVWDIWLSEGIR